MLNSILRFKIVSLFIFAFLSLSLLTQHNFAQSGKLIENLDIQGNRRLTDEQILKYIKIRPGEKFDEKQTQTDLQKILQSGLFDKTHTRVLSEQGLRGGVNIIFEIKELPLIVEVKFDGLRYVSESEILAALREQKIEIAPDKPYQYEDMRKAHEVIKTYLVKQRGFADAKVEITEEEVTATTLKVGFIIDEISDDGDDY